MRSPILSRKWPACFLAAALAACSAEPGNDSANGAGETGNEAAMSADANAAAPGGNESVPDGNGAAAADGGDSYSASGTEPFWSLTIGGGRMVYDSADGPDVTVPTPPQQPTRAGYRYVTAEMTVAVNTFQRCEAANGAEYHDTVRVTIGAATVTGCGGEVTAAAE
jgi:uncharacterized membrane protein